MSISAFGNKQVNVRLEPELFKETKAAADAQDVGVQDWIRTACRQALGHELDLPVRRSELDPLTRRLETLENKINNLTEGESKKKPLSAA